MTATQQKAQPPAAFYRPADACKYLGISRTKLHTLHETDTTFPRKLRMGLRCVGWRKEDLDKWLALKAGGASA